MLEIPPINLSDETREKYARHLQELPLLRPELKERVNSRLQTVLETAGDDDSVDLTLAKGIAAGLLTLIETAEDAHLPHVQAGVAYFSSVDDVTPDLESIAGFDDDAEVFNAICEHLGRGELEVV